MEVSSFPQWMQLSDVKIKIVYTEEGVGEEQGTEEEVGNIEKKSVDKGSPCNKGVKGSGGHGNTSGIARGQVTISKPG